MAAYFVTMKPWTPRNGTEAHLMAGTWTILRLGAGAVFAASTFHGPVIQ